VNLVEVNLGAALGCAIDINIDGNKLEAQKPAPVHVEGLFWTKSYGAGWLVAMAEQGITAHSCN
jgi:hypothetical protein